MKKMKNKIVSGIATGVLLLSIPLLMFWQYKTPLAEESASDEMNMTGEIQADTVFSITSNTGGATGANNTVTVFYKIAWNGNTVGSFDVVSDGASYHAYCAQHSKTTPSPGASFTWEVTTDPYLQAVMWFGSQGPGRWSGLGDEDAAEASTALAASYYNGDTNGTGSPTGTSINSQFIKYVGDNYGAVPVGETFNFRQGGADGEIINSFVAKQFDGYEGYCTDSIYVEAPYYSYFEFTVPSGVTLNWTDTTSGATGVVNGGDVAKIWGTYKFYFQCTDGSIYNTLGTWNSGTLTSSQRLKNAWLLRTGTAYQDMLSATYCYPTASFSVQWPSAGAIELQKASASPEVTNGNSCYTLEGAVYKLVKVGETGYALDANGNEITLTTDVNGYAKAENVPGGQYNVVEVQAPAGFSINSKPTEGAITINPGQTTMVNTTDQPGFDPINITLKKANASGEYLGGADYTINFYPGIQTTDEAALAGHGIERSWVLRTGDGTNGTIRGRALLEDAYKVSGPAFYMNTFGDVGFPLGTITIKETRAPVGYRLDANTYVYKVVMDEYGNTHVEGSNGIRDFNDNEVPEEELYANLNLQKSIHDTGSSQGDTGDVVLGGAVYALYARRDVVDVASGVTKVTATTATENTPVTFTSSGAAVQDRNGDPVIVKAGEPIPVAVLDPTDDAGKTSIAGLQVANNADDYYLKELIAPEGLLVNTEEKTVDLRDTADKTGYADSVNVNVSVSDELQKQPIRIMKYELIEDTGNGSPGIKTYNGIEFQVYLISSLTKLDSVGKVVNADGSVHYDFSNYDFSGERAEIVTADGQNKLVTGSTGNDGEAISIPLCHGEYVIVESKTSPGLKPIDPIIVSIPKYQKNTNGKIVLDANRNPVLFGDCNVDVLNVNVQYLVKINKKDATSDELILQNNAVFTLWNLDGLTPDQYSSEEDILANAEQISQNRPTESGYVPVTEFTTNSEGFLVLFEAFKYGEYAIIEKQGPEGYDEAEPLIFRVRQNGIQVLTEENGNSVWVTANTWKDTSGREYWEVVVEDMPFSLEINKVDSISGEAVEGAELCILKAVDSAGNLALNSDGLPVILEARDESGKKVEAVWTTTSEKKRFEVVPAGWYVVRETAAPDGYATRNDVVVYVGNSSEVTTNGKRIIEGDETIYYSFSEEDGRVVFNDVDSIEVNSKNLKLALPNVPITVEISKIDSSTEEELPGAILSLYRVSEEDELIETWTSTNEPHVIRYLTPGTYKLYENTVPLGFYTDKNEIEFEITDTEAIQKHVMINHPLIVDVTKKSFATNSYVEGATLALYRRVEEGEDLSFGFGKDESGSTVANDTESSAEKSEEDSAEDTETSTEENSTENAESSTEESESERTSFTDEDGTEWRLVERWVTTNETKSIQVVPGKYRLIEEITPYGYTTFNPVEFEVTDQEKPADVIVYDERIECRLVIHKVGESLVSVEPTECEYGEYTKLVWDECELAGVQFDIFDEEGNLIESMVTDEDGMAYSNVLDFGTYKIKEIVPNGYVDNHVVYTAQFNWMQGLTAQTVAGTIDVKNDSCNTQINLNKDAESIVFNGVNYDYVVNPVEGALFAIFSEEELTSYDGDVIVGPDVCLGYAITDTDGVASFNEKLLKGKYYAVEVQTAGPEFVLDNTRHSFELMLENNKISTFNLNATTPYVNKVAKGWIRVVKVSNDGQEPLVGAEFDLLDAANNCVAHLVTDKTGCAETEELPYGYYYLVETKAPEGYNRTNKQYEVRIIKDGEITVATIENAKIPKLGTWSIIWIVVLSMILTGLLTVVITMIKRRR